MPTGDESSTNVPRGTGGLHSELSFGRGGEIVAKIFVGGEGCQTMARVRYSLKAELMNASPGSDRLCHAKWMQMRPHTRSVSSR